MTIFTRTRTLLAATVHDWFDGVERPERLARHSLRELADALEAATLAVAKSIAAERWLNARSDETQKAVDHWHGRAATAMQSGVEHAARLALAQKFTAVQALASLEKQLADARQINIGLRAQLDDMRDRYQRARQQVDTATSRRAVAGAAAQFIKAGAAGSGIEAALDRLERSTLEAEVAAELNEAPNALEVRMAREQRDRYVQEELGRLSKT